MKATVPETVERLIVQVQQEYPLSKQEILDHIINLQNQGKLVLRIWRGSEGPGTVPPEKINEAQSDKRGRGKQTIKMASSNIDEKEIKKQLDEVARLVNEATAKKH